MFYFIAALLILVALFFLYSAYTAFNELRHGIKKKVRARPYMVVLFTAVAIFLIGLSYVSINYQPQWNHHWNVFWNIPDDVAEKDEPFISDETKSGIYNVSQSIESVTLYLTIGLGILFILSLVSIRKLSVHLFAGSIVLALVTFICFILSLYTEPNSNVSSHNQSSTVQSESKNQSNTNPKMADIKIEANKTAITRYLQNKNTDVLILSRFIRNYFRIPKNIDEANVDQLKQYIKGLTEIKQNLTNIEVPRGAEAAAKLSTDWVNQEIDLAAKSYALKRETGLLGLVMSFTSTVSSLVNDKEKEHTETTNKLYDLRSWADIQSSEPENVKDYFSFIK